MMSDAAATEPVKKKGGKKKMMVLIGAVLILGGGGAAAGFYAAGSMGGPVAPLEDPSKPALVLAGENPEEVANNLIAKAKEHPSTAGKAKPIDLPRPANPSAYQATYFQIPAPFTSNMADSDAFAQVSIAVSTYYDNRVIQAIQAHELAIRSSILLMLAQEQEIDLVSPQGKEALQKKLLKIINDTLKEKTGYGGVDNVYFTNFVIQ